MAKSIHLYLDDELEAIIKTVLSKTDDFEGENAVIRIATKKYLKEHYADLLLETFENDD